MTPSIFFQLSDAAKITMLYKEGFFVRERMNATYTIQLYYLDQNYYEVWKMNTIEQLIHISLVDEENALILFPAICEMDILKKSRRR
jgi:hypothetical protein